MFPSQSIQSTRHKAPTAYTSTPAYAGIECKSLYLNMRDGVRIAIDVYLPKGLAAGTKLPTLLHQSRYWRAISLRWPLHLLTDGLIGPEGKRLKEIIRNGYAFVNVDARGSGASFGERAHPWTADEVDDGLEIIDWIIAQAWSDGQLGLLGLSYSATAGEFLLTRGHPQVKAAMLLFSLFDVYDDIVSPGGVPYSWFIREWSHANQLLDNNRLPIKPKWLKWLVERFVVKGVKAVEGQKDVLQEAIQSHANNVDIHQAAASVIYRDDLFDEEAKKNIDVFSPHTYIDAINRAQIPIYTYSGWYDGAYQHGSIRRFLNYTHPHNKLTLGPWEHRGQLHISPAKPTQNGFDHTAELLKFFDCHLKGIANGLLDEPKVHYYTMGEEQWKACESWPPPNSIHQTWYIGENFELQTHLPIAEKASDAYILEKYTSTGRQTRWESMLSRLKRASTYRDRKKRDRELLCYTSTSLEAAIEVSGHPIIYAYIQSDSADGCVFVYLEDIAPNGKVSYVTEGAFRFIHRKISLQPAPYKDVIPYHSYHKADAAPMPPDEAVLICFDLLPTSYLFKKGHRIRIAIALADAEHFSTITPMGTEIQLFRTRELPSHIDLPVLSQGAL